MVFHIVASVPHTFTTSLKFESLNAFVFIFSRNKKLEFAIYLIILQSPHNHFCA